MLFSNTNHCRFGSNCFLESLLFVFTISKKHCFPEQFLAGTSLITIFQCMTLEGWTDASWLLGMVFGAQAHDGNGMQSMVLVPVKMIHSYRGLVESSHRRPWGGLCKCLHYIYKYISMTIYLLHMYNICKLMYIHTCLTWSYAGLQNSQQGHVEILHTYLKKFLKRQDDRNMDSLLFCWYQQWRRPKCQWFAWCNGTRISLVEFSFMIDLNWVGHYFHYVFCTYCIYSKYILHSICKYIYIYTCILCYHKNTFTFLSQCRCCPHGFLGSLRWCTGFRTAPTSWSFSNLTILQQNI